MKTNTHRADQLHRELLTTMVTDFSEESHISDERLKAVLSRDATFSDDEMRLLLSSAATRERYIVMKETLRAMAMRRWRKRKLQRPVFHLKAASSVHPYHEDCGDYELKMTPMNKEGTRWRLEMIFEQALIKDIPMGIRVREYEGEQRVFVQGIPDERRRLSAYFDNEDNLVERIIKYGLTIEPM